MLTWEPYGRLSADAMRKLVDRRQEFAGEWEDREQSERVCTMSVTLVNGERLPGVLKPHPYRYGADVLPRGARVRVNVDTGSCGFCGVGLYNEIHHDENGDPL